jgi:hypothetical protein
MPIKDLGKTLFCGFRSACDLYSTAGIFISITPMPQFCFYVAFEMIAVFDIDRKCIGNLLSGIKAQFQLFHWFDLLCDFPPKVFQILSM